MILVYPRASHTTFVCVCGGGGSRTKAVLNKKTAPMQHRLTVIEHFVTTPCSPRATPIVPYSKRSPCSSTSHDGQTRLGLSAEEERGEGGGEIRAGAGGELEECTVWQHCLHTLASFGSVWTAVWQYTTAKTTPPSNLHLPPSPSWSLQLPPPPFLFRREGLTSV